MYYYKAFGLNVASDLPIRQLVSAEDEAFIPDIEIRKGEVPADLIHKSEIIHYEFGKKFSWLTNTTCWLVVQNGHTINYALKKNGRPSYLTSYIMGWGMSMVALQRGTLAFHCSAIADEKGALLICGESGVGKSTVTTEFLENGYRLMADDMSFINTIPGEKAIATPAFPYQKLCRDAALAKGYPLEELIYIDEDKDKFLVPYKKEYNLEPVAVKGVIMLGVNNGDEVVVKEITGLSKFQLVANNLFLRHLLGPQKYQPEIGQLCLDMAAVVPMAYITRPTGKDSLQEVLENAKRIAESW